MPIRKLLFALCCFLSISVFAQNSAEWNGKKCAVVLTYDDAIDIDFTNVIPALDSFNFKGTFYVIGSSPVVNKRIEDWRKAAKNGHELGNHALFHPCDGSRPGRDFAKGEHDLSTYTVKRATDEIKMNNVLLKAIDGKDKRTFAYPCGDLKIGDVFFYDSLKNDFAGARGTTPGLQKSAQVDLSNVDCYSINGQNADYMIDLVKKAQQSGTLLVFLFHGVGGGHNLNVDLAAHSKMLHYLKANEKDIWVATMVDVAEKIKSSRK